MKSIPKAVLTAAVMLAAITAAVIMAAMPWVAAEAQELDNGNQITVQAVLAAPTIAATSQAPR